MSTSKQKTGQSKKLSAKEMSEVKGGAEINVPHFMNPLHPGATTKNVASPSLRPVAGYSSTRPGVNTVKL